MVIKRISTMLGGSKKGDSGSSSSSTGGFLSRRRNDDVGSPSRAMAEDYTASSGDSPEASAARGVRMFCESGGPNNQGEEVLHLPTIVEAAESSPAAAASSALQIRKFMTKDNYNRPHVIYNAIMLIRILSDNPGPTFTRNIDTKFVSTTKDVLRNCKDPSVQQMLRETLNALYADKAYDTGLAELFKMWGKEQGVETGRLLPQRPPNVTRASSGQHSQLSQVPSRTRRTLPSQAELAARVEESRTSAKLLQQLIQSTAPNELLGNDLIKEFAERCQSAQRSMQDYLNCDNPPPDDDTMQTLIETSEQLSLESSKHSRAILQARRAENASLGVNNDPTTPASGISSLHTQSPGVSSMSSALPESNNTALPYGVTTGSYPPRMVSPPASTSSTFVPAGIPPVAHSGYAPPPMPPASYLANKRLSGAQPEPIDPYAPSHPSRNSGYGLPMRGGPPGNKNSAYDNPFADDHAQEHHEEHDDLYNNSPIAPRGRNTFNDIPAISTTTPTGTYHSSTGSPTSASTPRQSQLRPNAPPMDSWRQPERAGPNGSYAPGYHSTPSYLHRQESSGDNITMTGAMGAAPTSLTALGGNPVRSNVPNEHGHQRNLSDGSGRVSLIQEREFDDDHHNNHEEEDPTTPVSQNSPGFMRQQLQQQQQQYRGAVPDDRTSGNGYSSYGNAPQLGTIHPRSSTQGSHNNHHQQTYTGASLPPSQRVPAQKYAGAGDATTSPPRPQIPSQNTGYGPYSSTHPATTSAYNTDNEYAEHASGNPYHDEREHHHHDDDEDDGELNMQGQSSLGVPNSYLNSAEGGGVHRSNTLSTIMSESEYAPSVRGGGRRGYDER